jgi:hypothetical protein
MSFAGIAVGVGLTLSAGAAVYGATEQGQVANSQLGLERQTASEQMSMFNQLQKLLSDPGSFFSSPVYQAAFGQGTQAVARAGAAQFGPNSGNEASALQAYGQSFGQQQLLSQEQLLLSGAGVTNASSPSQAGNAASGAAGAAGSSLNSLAGLLTFLGGSNSGTSSPYTYGPGGLNPGSAPGNYWPGGGGGGTPDLGIP